MAKTQLIVVSCLLSLLLLGNTLSGDVAPMVEYFPGAIFANKHSNVYEWQTMLPRKAVENNKVNAMIRFENEDAITILNYPATTALIAGIHDTLMIEVQFLNRTDTNIVLTGENLHEWFAPRLYRTTMDIVNDVPVIDSIDMHYATETCVDSLDFFNPPDTILAGNQSHIIAYNVWGFPEGVWVLTLGTTSKTPEYLNVIYDGVAFEYRSPESGQDTVNAWLALAERQRNCRDYAGALDWIEKVVIEYPHSVPGWWTKASLHTWHGDSLLAFQAFDSTFKFLDEKLDPLLPDTTGSVEHYERLYMRALRLELEFFKYGAVHYGFWK